MHPNLIPVKVFGPKDLEKLAKEMKQVCRDDPETEYIPGSESVGQALVKSMRDARDIASSGHLRVVELMGERYGIVVSCVLTLDTYTKPFRWDLSLSRPNFASPGEPIAVSDAVAGSICRGFLGKKYKEIDRGGAFRGVRRFVATARGETPKAEGK